MLFKNKIKYFNIIVTIIILCIFGIILFKIFNKNVIFNVDDLNSTIDSYPLWKEENGRYVCNIISRIFCLHIPHLFGIHFQDAINSIGAIVYSIIVILACSAAAFFCSIKEKSIFVFNLLLIFSVLCFGLYLSIVPILCYTVIISFQYGYVLATFFSLAFIYILFDYFINNKINENITPKRLFLCMLIAFCAGNSTQIAVYSDFVILALILLFIIISNRFNISRIKKELSDKKLLYIVAAFIFGSLLMILCPGFWNEIGWRHAQSFTEITENFIPFTKSFINVVLMLNIEFFKFILVLITILIIKNILLKKSFKETIKIIIFALIPIVAVLTYYFSLIMLGPSFPSPILKFWTYEPFYKIYLFMVLAAVTSFLIGYITYNLNNKLLKIIVLTTICLIFYKMQIFPNMIDPINKMKQNLVKARQEVYICEKIVLFNIYNNNQEFSLPNFCQDYHIYSGFPTLSRYLKPAYNLEKEMRINYNEFGINEFYEAGGDITCNEMKKQTFKNLKDEKYTTNRNRKTNEHCYYNPDI